MNQCCWPILRNFTTYPNTLIDFNSIVQAFIIGLFLQFPKLSKFFESSPSALLYLEIILFLISSFSIGLWESGCGPMRVRSWIPFWGFHNLAYFRSMWLIFYNCKCNCKLFSYGSLLRCLKVSFYWDFT